MHFPECTDNAADHNLDLSLGGSSSKKGSREMGENRDQNSSLQLDARWGHQGSRPNKVNNIVYLNFLPLSNKNVLRYQWVMME